MRPWKASLGVVALFVVGTTLLACADQPTEVAAPDGEAPAFDHKGKPHGPFSTDAITTVFVRRNGGGSDFQANRNLQVVCPEDAIAVGGGAHLGLGAGETNAFITGTAPIVADPNDPDSVPFGWEAWARTVDGEEAPAVWNLTVHVVCAAN